MSSEPHAPQPKGTIAEKNMLKGDDAPLPSPGIRLGVPPVVFVLLFGLSGAAHWWLTRDQGLVAALPSLWVVGLGALLAVAGFVFMMWAWFHFVFVGTTVTVHLPVDRLVENGAFRFSRNPMYVGFVALLLAAAIGLLSLPFLIAAAILFFYLAYYVIPREEACMRETFGARYEAYANRVRRWV